jgi:hypothetical protein
MPTEEIGYNGIEALAAFHQVLRPRDFSAGNSFK